MPKEITFADKMLEGVAVSLMGFLIVFLVLVIIMAILSIFNLIAKRKSKKTADTADTENTVDTTSAAAPVTQTAPEPDLVSDTQLVAVITAAIMAAEAENGREGTDGLVVRSIRRVTTWNQEAINEQTNLY